MAESFPALVKKELVNAREFHRPHHSMHESYAVILEELDECWDEIKLRDPSKAAVLHELIQMAAMCQRAAEDLHLMDV